MRRELRSGYRGGAPSGKLRFGFLWLANGRDERCVNQSWLRLPSVFDLRRSSGGIRLKMPYGARCRDSAVMLGDSWIHMLPKSIPSSNLHSSRRLK